MIDYIHVTSVGPTTVEGVGSGPEVTTALMTKRVKSPEWLEPVVEATQLRNIHRHLGPLQSIRERGLHS